MVLNNVNVTSLEKFTQAAKTDPQQAKKSKRVEGVWNFGEAEPQFEATIPFQQGETVLKADLAPFMGGGGRAPDPVQYCLTQERRQRQMGTVLNIAKFLHILSAVFMSAPLYSLIIVNERGMLGRSMIYQVDRFLENIIRRNSKRCYMFQLTVLVTGVLLVSEIGLATVLTNWVLTAKTALLLVMAGLLSYVHFGIQPKVEALLSEVSQDPIPDPIAAAIKPLRVRRKRLAAVCLFILITILVLSIQIFARYHPALTGALVVVAALFSWRVYKGLIPYGWV